MSDPTKRAWQCPRCLKTFRINIEARDPAHCPTCTVDIRPTEQPALSVDRSPIQKRPDSKWPWAWIVATIICAIASFVLVLALTISRSELGRLNTEVMTLRSEIVAIDSLKISKSKLLEYLATEKVGAFTFEEKRKGWILGKSANFPRQRLIIINDGERVKEVAILIDNDRAATEGDMIKGFTTVAWISRFIAPECDSGDWFLDNYLKVKEFKTRIHRKCETTDISITRDLGSGYFLTRFRPAIPEIGDVK